MISSSNLALFGLDKEGFKKRFDKPVEKLSDKHRRLVERWQARVQSGRDFGLSHWRHYHALDRALNEPFYHVSRGVMELVKNLKTGGEEAAVQTAQDWGMAHMLTDASSPETKPRLNIPVIVNVSLGLARSSTIQRASRLSNERITEPILDYQPAYASMQNRAKTEVITQVMSQMARDFGYHHSIRQAVLKAAAYGQQLMFPMEEWYSRLNYGGPGTESRTGKAGVRLSLPHMSRTYWDISHPFWTLGPGTGSSYAGHWGVTTVGEVLNNNEWWNLKRIKNFDLKGIGTRGIGGYPGFSDFSRITGQCVLSTGAQVCSNPLDREKVVDGQYYSRDQADWPVFRTEHFERINPLEDLDPLDNMPLPDTDLWIRVVMVDDCTPMYVGALNDRAVIPWVWEAVDSNTLQVGHLHEAVQYGDLAGNIMTQANVIMLNNLRSVTLYDSDILNKEDIRKMLESPNDEFYRRNHQVGLSVDKVARLGTTLEKLFYDVPFRVQSIDQLLVMLGQVITLADRVLNTAPQEYGSQASHEQSAEEMSLINAGTSQRPVAQGYDLDDAMFHLKCLVHAQWSNRGDGNAIAYIETAGRSNGTPKFTAQFLSSIGFTVESEDEVGISVKVPIDNLRVEEFVSKNPHNKNWHKIGTLMIQLVQSVFSSSQAVQSMGPGRLIQMLNMALDAMDLPKDFRMNEPNEDEISDVRQWVMQQFDAYTKQVKGFVGEEKQGMMQQLLAAVSGGATPMPQGQPQPQLNVA